MPSAGKMATVRGDATSARTSSASCSSLQQFRSGRSRRHGARPRRSWRLLKEVDIIRALRPDHAVARRMCNVAEMEYAKGFRLPLLIGGATKA
ncbi:MAG: hypothetical protein HPM95_08700 [Alphaproteobacteria bacterium]|nr:hypothetical protein [Alphaproteobacteria bacterium]